VPSLTSTHCRGAPEGLGAMARAGLDVMGFCSNHCLDYGYTAAFETVEGLARNGIKATGFGSDLAAARAPAILDVKGVKVGFLAYTTVAPPGYGAADGRPGCATLRVHTIFENFQEGQPGTAGSVLTIADPRDVAAMQDAVAAVKRQVDIVVVSVHWGIEMQVGRAAIDAGADLVLGHHHHILKAVEIYKSKAIFHGLGNFVFDLGIEDLPPALVARLVARSGPLEAAGQKPARPWAFSEASRQTMVVLARMGRDGVAPALPHQYSWPAGAARVGRAGFRSGRRLCRTDDPRGWL
jgi:poly-gamma-glutamate capsule biosynthesis protein CapA/YwtB (metallophosphatase superfamily)